MAYPNPPVELLPQLIWTEDGGEPKSRIDTTPLIRHLEASFSGRSVIPTDPVMAFLDYLIEDYADEWLTKAMFHYRWAFAADVARAQMILPRWFKTDGDEATAVATGEAFGARQIARRAVVGSNDVTGPVIEASYRRLLGALRERLAVSRFVCGARPGACDFGLYGQLTQLAGFDPTPRALTYELAPRVSAWVDVADDLSGVEPGEDQWLPREKARQELGGLLREIGRVYPPFLLANAEALRAGADEVVCSIDGAEWRQKPFPYQGKCLGWIRAERAALGADDRAFVDSVLDGTGCETLFAG